MKSKLYFDQYLLKVNVVSIVFLLIFGIFLVSSATAVESQRIYSDSFYMIKNHFEVQLVHNQFIFIFNFNNLI